MIKGNKYKVLYKGLKSTEKERECFENSIFLNIHDTIPGFQRGLIVVKYPDNDRTLKAYSAAGFFIDHDGDTGEIQFSRENKKWDEREIKKTLSYKGPVLEKILLLNKEFEVILDKPETKSISEGSYPLIGHQIVYTLPLEKYLMDKLKAFPRLSYQHDKSFWDTIDMRIELHSDK